MRPNADKRRALHQTRGFGSNSRGVTYSIQVPGLLSVHLPSDQCRFGWVYSDYIGYSFHQRSILASRQMIRESELIPRSREPCHTKALYRALAADKHDRLNSLHEDDRSLGGLERFRLEEEIVLNISSGAALREATSFEELSECQVSVKHQNIRPESNVRY